MPVAWNLRLGPIWELQELGTWKARASASDMVTWGIGQGVQVV